MSQTLGQYIQSLEESLSVLVERFPGMILDTGQTLTNEIADRIQQRGLDDELNPLKAYTPSYLAYKKNKGKYSGGVDYSYTGALWNDIGLIEEEVSQTRVRYSWGATQQINKDKLESLGKRDGEVLQPSKDEIQLAEELIDEEILEIFNVN